MESKILLNYSENVKNIEEEEKFKFLQYILSNLALPDTEDLLNIEYSELDIDTKLKLKKVLMDYHINVVEGEDIDVYIDKDLIAKMEKPTYKIKRDMSEVDPKKQLYQEMTVRFYSLFEEQE